MMIPPKLFHFSYCSYLSTFLMILPLTGCEKDDPNTSDSADDDSGDNNSTGGSESSSNNGDTGSEESNSGESSDSGDPDQFQLRGACPANERVGGFRIQLTDSYTAIDGSTDDSVYPTSLQTEVSSEGDCTLYRRDNPVCIPPCEKGKTCDHDGMCIDEPIAQSVGTLSFSGLVTEVSIDPVEPGFNYFYTELPHPGFTEGSEISLVSDGVLDQNLKLFGLGIRSIEIGDTEWTIKRGEGITITWEPSGDDRMEVVSTLNIDQHGNSPTTIVCKTPDVGKTEITAAVLIKLLDSGISGFPSGTVTRRSIDNVSTTFGNGKTGCIDFMVTNTAEVSVMVDGHTACSTDAECPEGQHCNVAINTCVDD